MSVPIGLVRATTPGVDEALRRMRVSGAVIFQAPITASCTAPSTGRFAFAPIATGAVETVPAAAASRHAGAGASAR